MAKSEFNHKKRHILLHKNLDELLADFIIHTGEIPTDIQELLNWSSKQITKPTEVA